MSDQNVDFELDENVENLKSHPNNGDGSIDQLDIGGFLNDTGSNNQSESSDNNSENNNQDDSDNLDQFLKS